METGTETEQEGRMTVGQEASLGEETGQGPVGGDGAHSPPVSEMEPKIPESYLSSALSKYL